jgi:hypothetical protein
MHPTIQSQVVPSVRPSERTPAAIAREFRRLLDAGALMRPAGSARARPGSLLSRGYTPRYKIELFDTVFYVTGTRQNPDLRFYVAYVVQTNATSGRTEIFPRLFYKDVSLVWRAASHYIPHPDGYWIGKGEVRACRVDGETLEASVESTTDLPYEIQFALESLLRGTRRIPFDEAAIDLVLRRAPAGRLEPYRDFLEPRLRARSNPRNRIHGGRSIARFTRRNDPGSLRFAPGFEPDFSGGRIDCTESHSRLYGGRVQRFRILSRNRRVQYLFFAGGRHVWIAPPQATTTELSSFGIRTVDVEADEDLSIPGYEYHFLDATEDPPQLVSQIPEGYVGEPSEVDDSRCDASPWLDRLPVVREFRRTLLRGRGALAPGAPRQTARA